MDKIDKYIQELMNQEIEEPERYKKVVANALKHPRARIRIYKYQVLRVLSVVCTITIMISGTAFAGVIAYKKVWQEPKEYNYQELKQMLADVDIPEEDRVGLLTEDEAKEKAYEILNNLGYANQEIVSVELKKDINQENGEYYSMETDTSEEKGYDISISARTGELNSFTDKGLAYRNIKTDNIGEETAKQYADNIFSELNYNNGDFEFMNCNEVNYSLNDKLVKLWEAKYVKEYGDIYNPYEFVDVNFFIDNGDLKIRKINKVKQGKYAENPIKVSKEDAIEVAKNKEMEFTSDEISSITIELGIRKMNTYIYRLENSINFQNNDETDYKMEKIESEEARNVWIIEIRHINNDISKETNVNKAYYIDTTTKEIIGGKEIL